MKTYFIAFVLFTLPIMASAQDSTNYYYQIPDYPASYNAATVAARLMDGLGFRYYWASEGLTEQELAYRPSEEGRSIDEALDHLLGLTRVAANATLEQPNGQSPPQELTYQEKRAQTLAYIKTASDILKGHNQNDLDAYKVVFQRGDNTNEFPFWNLINGPIADALWHVGQVVTLRRSAGNPISGKISVFTGTVRK